MQTQLDSDDDDNDDNNAVSSTKSIEGKGTLGRYTSPHDRIWDEHFQCLVAYKKEYNSTTVPKAYKVNDLNLGIWVQRQRKNFRNDELSEERINHLESIGFVWNSYDAQWMETYQRLVAYKKQHKSTDVPFVYKVNGLFLGRWVNRQRTYFKNNELSEERINHLESIDFVWDSYDAQWMEMYNKLVEYKRQHHGSTPVRRGYTEDPSLGKWIYDQSYAYNKGNLLGKRLKLLNAINFDWS
ncbi:HA-domain-containing protein [Fragilariopsis cylindrus CCMP1102]|uniref:HA-domain-containing protein n=1 Tax=Fragilariopsis cylindrus CCMP1102 TaxID=635003 RepID=A0A1E7FIW7_9STRA|nr:HA-domain-containing protein [Fragilariopsis cylindrus CCMP1102]|eukprot:OEU18116.1 HA-domain-containing protein [Fragilariopsis cylindrus CCMP1102]